MPLLDINGAFAAVNQSHQDHERMTRWLDQQRDFATCGLTQIGVFRLLLTEAAMSGHPLEADQAHAVLASLVDDPKHRFVASEPIDPNFVGKTAGQRAAFDDYLVQIAQNATCKLATFDRPLTRRWPKHTLLIH